MKILPQLFEANRDWAASMLADEPDFFNKLAEGQSPKYLWIGCSDSRVPANQIVGLPPGEVFVHRNVANVVVHTDFNCLSVIEFAVQVLEVHHIIVCGHYGCGGVAAAGRNLHLGLIDNWLRHIRDVRGKHATELAAIEDPEARRDRLCELNVVEQVHNVARTTVVQEAWEADRPISIHGWIYAVKDGLLQDLDVTMSKSGELSDAYRVARGPA